MRTVSLLAVVQLGFASAWFLLPRAVAQSSIKVDSNIKGAQSTVRWCLPDAGNDPAGIIGGRCEVYRECLANAELDESADRKPFPKLFAGQVEALRKCHQALYNAARVNPQIKGSEATQQWLVNLVYPGTQAKPFSTTPR
jgi:hypothetical protein